MKLASKNKLYGFLPCTLATTKAVSETGGPISWPLPLSGQVVVSTSVIQEVGCIEGLGVGGLMTMAGVTQIISLSNWAPILTFVSPSFFWMTFTCPSMSCTKLEVVLPDLQVKHATVSPVILLVHSTVICLRHLVQAWQGVVASRHLPSKIATFCFWSQSADFRSWSADFWSWSADFWSCSATSG